MFLFFVFIYNEACCLPRSCNSALSFLNALSMSFVIIKFGLIGVKALNLCDLLRDLLRDLSRDLSRDLRDLGIFSTYTKITPQGPTSSIGQNVQAHRHREQPLHRAELRNDVDTAR
jgi:hypothetical protein